MKLLLKARRALKQLRGFFPSKLPVGVQEFDELCSELFETYELPDMPSYKHAVASMIMHLGPTTSSKPKRFFAKSILKAMANQVAYERIQALKKEEQEYIEATMAKVEAGKEALKEADENPEVTFPESGPGPLQNQSL